MRENLSRLDDELYVSISEPRRYKDKGGARRRDDFSQKKAESQNYVVVSLTDHSSGHGVVKNFTLRNPHEDFIKKIGNPNFWEIRKNVVKLVTDQATQIPRTFRTVYLRTAAGDQLMTNSLETQVRNLAENTTVRHEGEEHHIIGYLDSKGDYVELVTDDELDPPKGESEPPK